MLPETQGRRAISHSTRCSHPDLIDPWGDEYRKNPHAFGALVCPECGAKEFWFGDWEEEAKTLERRKS